MLLRVLLAFSTILVVSFKSLPQAVAFSIGETKSLQTICDVSSPEIAGKYWNNYALASEKELLNLAQDALREGLLAAPINKAERVEEASILGDIKNNASGVFDGFQGFFRSGKAVLGLKSLGARLSQRDHLCWAAYLGVQILSRDSKELRNDQRQVLASALKVTLKAFFAAKYYKDVIFWADFGLRTPVTMSDIPEYLYWKTRTYYAQFKSYAHDADVLKLGLTSIYRYENLAQLFADKELKPKGAEAINWQAFATEIELMKQVLEESDAHRLFEIKGLWYLKRSSYMPHEGFLELNSRYPWSPWAVKAKEVLTKLEKEDWLASFEKSKLNLASELMDVSRNYLKFILYKTQNFEIKDLNFLNKSNLRHERSQFVEVVLDFLYYSARTSILGGDPLGSRKYIWAFSNNTRDQLRGLSQLVYFLAKESPKNYSYNSDLLKMIEARRLQFSLLLNSELENTCATPLQFMVDGNIHHDSAAAHEFFCKNSARAFGPKTALSNLYRKISDAEKSNTFEAFDVASEYAKSMVSEGVDYGLLTIHPLIAVHKKSEKSRRFVHCRAQELNLIDGFIVRSSEICQMPTQTNRDQSNNYISERDRMQKFCSALDSARTSCLAEGIPEEMRKPKKEGLEFLKTGKKYQKQKFSRKSKYKAGEILDRIEASNQFPWDFTENFNYQFDEFLSYFGSYFHSPTNSCENRRAIRQDVNSKVVCKLAETDAKYEGSCGILQKAQSLGAKIVCETAEQDPQNIEMRETCDKINKKYLLSNAQICQLSIDNNSLEAACQETKKVYEFDRRQACALGEIDLELEQSCQTLKNWEISCPISKTPLGQRGEIVVFSDAEMENTRRMANDASFFKSEALVLDSIEELGKLKLGQVNGTERSKALLILKAITKYNEKTFSYSEVGATVPKYNLVQLTDKLKGLFYHPKQVDLYQMGSNRFHIGYDRIAKRSLALSPNLQRALGLYIAALTADAPTLLPVDNDESNEAEREVYATIGLMGELYEYESKKQNRESSANDLLVQPTQGMSKVEKLLIKFQSGNSEAMAQWWQETRSDRIREAQKAMYFFKKVVSSVGYSSPWFAKSERAIQAAR